MTADTLEPCPFCGSERITLGYSGQPATSFHAACLALDWLVEGGIHEVGEGAWLAVIDNLPLPADGALTLYADPPVAQERGQADAQWLATFLRGSNDHDPACDAVPLRNPGPCNCGLAEAIKRADRLAAASAEKE